MANPSPTPQVRSTTPLWTGVVLDTPTTAFIDRVYWVRARDEEEALALLKIEDYQLFPLSENEGEDGRLFHAMSGRRSRDVAIHTAVRALDL